MWRGVVWCGVELEKNAREMVQNNVEVAVPQLGQQVDHVQPVVRQLAHRVPRLDGPVILSDRKRTNQQTVWYSAEHVTRRVRCGKELLEKWPKTDVEVFPTRLNRASFGSCASGFRSPNSATMLFDSCSSSTFATVSFIRKSIRLGGGNENPHQNTKRQGKQN